MTPLEIGSDLSGSVRLPAHFCGVYALKTTEHRVPTTGFFRPPPGTPQPVRIMTTLGPVARDLADLELAVRVVAGPDGHDADVPPVPLPPRRRCVLERLRLAAVPTLPGLTVARSIRQRLQDVAAAASDAGAIVDESLPELDWASLHALFRDLLMAITSVFDPESTLRDEQRTLAWYLDALARRDRFLSAWETFFESVDALVLPAASTSAFTHRAPGAPIDVDGAAVSYWTLPGLLTFCNLTGLPALVVPAGTDDRGLPIGLQIIGPRWSEQRLLDIARALERAGILPGFRAPPLAR
jgi:amidase